MRRVMLVLAVMATVAVPTSVAVIGMAPSASAAVSVTCAKLKGTETGSVTAKKCSVSKADKKLYKSLTAAHAAQLVTGGTLTWSSSGKTTVVGAPTLTSAPAGACPSKDTGEIATGRVTGGTSAITHAGDTFRAEVCLTSKGKISEAKGVPVDL